MGLELFEVHFMTLLSTDHIFSHNLPNFCKYFFRRTSAGKICITCRRPSKKIIRHFSEGRRQDFSIDHKVFSNLSENFRKYFLGRTSAGKNILLQTFFFFLEDIGRVNSMTEDNLMFVYERVFYKLTSNPPRVDPLSSWL